MTTINDKFNQLGTSIINIVGTRASKNLDNLSEIGLNNLVAIADAATSRAMSDYVPTTRTVNSKPLSSDISLTASDVGAASSSHTHSGYVSTSSLVTAYFVTETYKSGSDWYRVWSDGWCEQGGTLIGTTTNTTNIPLLKTYKDAYYQVLFGNLYTTTATATPCVKSTTKTASSFDIIDTTTAGFNTEWYTCGYLY